MESCDYYKTVNTRLKNAFDHSGCAISIDNDLVNDGYPKSFPKMTAPKESLELLTAGRGLQIHLPIIGKDNKSVLCPMDFEIFLGNDQGMLYADKETQKALFKETIPVIDYITKIFTDNHLPFLLDYTPSGGHILFHVMTESPAGKALQSIGFVEEGMLKAGIKNSLTLEAMLLFSGITRIAEYVALRTVMAFKDNKAKGLLEVNISDSSDRCVNVDNSWCEGAPHNRSIRSPFSLHKKNREKYKRLDEAPLVDVIGGYFDGRSFHHRADIDNVIDCMWDLEKASKWAQNFSGHIPEANDSMVNFVELYKESALYDFHREFDTTPDLLPGAALEKARKENGLPGWTKSILYEPNPRAVQPINMIGFIYDFIVYGKWAPKHVANILRDIYMDKSFNWVQNFEEDSPADEKANFWVRSFGAIAYCQNGHLDIK